MIPLASLFAFLTVFFIIYGFSNMVQSEERQKRAHIINRLRVVNEKTSEFQIEKNRRLSDLNLFNRILMRIKAMKKLQHFITQGGFHFSVGSFLLFSSLLSALAFLFSLLTGIHFSTAFLVACGFFFFPYVWVNFKRAARTRKFSDRFPDAISLIGSSLRAGHSLQMAIGTVINEGKDIVSVEFEKILSEVEVGQSFEEALKGILDRIDTPELRLFVSAVILQRETGGNLAEILDSLENVIRDRQELKRELKATTAQVRLSGTVLSLLPLLVSLFVLIIHPDYILFFIKDSLGTKLLIACLIGQGLGIMTIQKIVRIQL
ncbi:MAG: type II secretion system F family protein [Candidatus Omnitrophica bacterium]|nr:type II secretion system F family protein [Candidatus Omnitrophota bacterium]